eukprot:665784-Pyramimonas_sp.AAC.1
MAPKRAGPQAERRGKRGRPATCQPSTDPICEWIEFDPCVCQSCEQPTHEVDRDSPLDKPYFLVWNRAKPVDPKKPHVPRMPCGSECYKCYDTRR